MKPEIEQYIDKLIAESPKGCGLEGIGNRPDDCPNNPWRHPDAYRPAVCRQCPGNENIWQVADGMLPPIYMREKQGELVEGLSLTILEKRTAPSFLSSTDNKPSEL